MFFSVEVDEVRCIRNDDDLDRRVYQVFFQLVSISKSRPEVSLRCEHKSRHLDKRRIPQLPSGGQIEAVLKGTVWRAKARRFVRVRLPRLPLGRAKHSYLLSAYFGSMLVTGNWQDYSGKRQLWR